MPAGTVSVERDVVRRAVKRLVAEAPELTPEQAARLRVLLSAGPAGDR